MALAPLITEQQLSDFLSALVLQRICDDAGEGEAAVEAVESILAYASSMLRGKLGQVENLSAIDEDLRPEVTRIGLEICQARAAIRHPEVMRMDGFELMKMAKSDLKAIRVNEAGLGTRDKPAQTEYAAVIASSPRRW